MQRAPQSIQDLTIEPAILIIRSSKRWELPSLSGLWEYRELLYFLVWRDIKVRYKQTVLGVLWAVLQPLLTMIVFSVFFGNLAGVPSDGIPYPIFTYTALLPWQLFARVLNESGKSIVSNRDLVTKVYFPRILIPLAPVLSALVDFGISGLVFLGLMVYYGIVPTVAVLTLPLFLLLTLATALAAGLWLSALNAKYRDVGILLPFLAQFWLFATPIAYPSSLVPESWRAWYGLNPMVGVVDGFRWALLGTAASPGLPILVSALVVAFLLIGGLYYFRQVEKTLADIV